MTTAEMVTLVRDKFGEDSTSATQITDAQILKFLNEKQTELCSLSDISATTFTTSTVASQQVYNVPPEYTRIKGIQIYRTSGNLQKQWLKRVEVTDLDPSFQEGSPYQWATWGANLSGDNTPVFLLDPIPDASGTSDLIVHCRQLPKTMVSAGQGPEVRLEWQYVVVDGAVAEVYMRLASGDPSLIRLADRKVAKWEAGKRDAMERASLENAAPRPAQNTRGY